MLSLCVFFAIISAAPLPVHAKNKLEKIDADIKKQEDRKGNGILFGVIGLGVGILTPVVASTLFTNDLNSDFSSGSSNAVVPVLVVGEIVATGCLIYGGYEFFDASNQESHLKAKRYDLEEGMLNFNDNAFVFGVPRLEVAKGRITTTLAKATF